MEKLGKLSSKRICVALISIVVFGYSASKMIKINVASKWPTTAGVVLHKKYVSSGCQIVYEYQVSGKLFRSDKFDFIGYLMPDQLWDRHLPYQEGKLIDVYYNPANPNEAVIATVIPVSGYLSLGIAALACIFSTRPLFKK